MSEQYTDMPSQGILVVPVIVGRIFKSAPLYGQQICVLVLSHCPGQHMNVIIEIVVASAIIEGILEYVPSLGNI